MADQRIEEVDTLPVVEEQLQLSRKSVETGAAVRLRKEVHEEPARFAQELTYDVVDAQRVPVGRVIDAPMPIRQEGDVTIVPVIAERLVTRAELVLVEEIHIRRRSEVRREAGEVTLKHESVVVERRDPETQQWVNEEER
jgi:stress response protein YsnF